MSSNATSKYVIFDLDGTLIDSYDSICHSISKTLKLLNASPLSIYDILYFRDKPLSDLFKFAYRKISLVATMEQFKNVFDLIYNDDCCEKVPIITTAYNYLTQDIAKGYQIIILTNKRQDIATKICKCLFPTIPFMIIGRTDSICTKKDYLDRLPLVALIDHYYGDSEEDRLIADLLSIKFIKIENIKGATLTESASRFLK